MNRRDTLMALAGAAGGLSALPLSGCAATPATDDRMVVDDGTSEITPVYVMTYTDGEPTVFVRANFYYFAAKKQVQLRTDGAIRVNAMLLKHDPSTLTSYIGHIPFNESLTFEFTRSKGNAMQHQFSLPQLEVLEFPRVYPNGAPLSMRLRSGPTPDGVTQDSISITVSGRHGEPPRVLRRLLH